MSVLKRSFLYIRRKKSRTFLLFIVLFVISTAILSGVTIKKATHASREKINESINASFEVENDMRSNPGIGDRGFGTVPQSMINAISKQNGIREYNTSLISEAMIKSLKKVPLENARVNYDQEMETLLKYHYDFEGVRKSDLDAKFVSGVLTLSQGRHLDENDKNKVLVHEDFAKINNLKLHDSITYSSHDYNKVSELQNEKVEIVGMFTGSNKDKANHSTELFENIIVSDIKTAAALRGFKEDVLYQSASFFLNNPKEMDQVLKEVGKLDIDWQKHILRKSEQTFAGLTTSLDSMDKLVNQMITGSFIVSILILSVILWFWIGTRVHETGVLLSLGLSKFNVISQYILEVMLIACLSFSLSFLTSDKLAQNIGNSLIKQAQSQTLQQQNQELGGMNLGADANTSVTSKTIDAIDIKISKQELLEVAALGSVIIVLSVIGASAYIVRLKPKEILSKMS